jgi:hypothetical protein
LLEHLDVMVSQPQVISLDRNVKNAACSPQSIIFHFFNGGSGTVEHHALKDRTRGTNI